MGDSIICPECAYDYASFSHGEAPSELVGHAARLSESLVGRKPRPETSTSSWSAIEYAGHVRDVLVTMRERFIQVRLRDDVIVEAMGRDERVDWGEYAQVTPQQAAEEITLVAGWLAHTWELLSPDDWTRTLLYNYPTPTSRPLSWAGAHTLHEVVHHHLDINRATVA